MIDGLRHEGGGVCAVVLPSGTTFRIGQSYLDKVRTS